MADTIEISVKNEDATEVTWPPTKASFKDLNGENGEEKSQTNGQQASAQENGLSISSASNSAAASIKMVSGVNAITGLVTMPLLQQTGKVFVGPGAEKEAQVLCLGLAKLRSYQKDDLERAKRYAQDQSVKHVLTKQQIAHQQNQQKISTFTQALSLMARVYIGSISFEIREDMIKQAFGAFGTIKTINMSYDTLTGHHKGFAFLEYEVPEAAQLAIDTMSGRLMGGRNLKVGRAQTMPQAQPIIDMIMSEAINYHRIYVASVHPDLTEQDLKSVFKAFGEISKCQLAKQPTGGRHRGFGYIDFSNARAVKESIDGMNGFDLGGQHLQVGRCITPPDALTYLTMQISQQKEALPNAAAVAAATATAKIQAREILEQQEKKPSPSDSPKSIGADSPTTAAVSAASPLVEAAAPTSTPPYQGSPGITQASPSNAAASPSQQQAGGSGRRRGGFGGFATTVPPPSIVQSLPAPPGLFQPQNLTVNQTQSIPPPAVTVSLAPPGLLPQQSNPQLYFNNGNQQKLTPPQYQQPLSGGAGAPSVALPYATIQQQQDGGVPTESFAEKPETGGQNNDKISAQPDETIDDFYSVLLDPTFRPPPLSTVPSAPTVSTPSEAPPPGAAAAPSQEIKTQPKKKEKEKKDILSRIGDRLEARTQMYDASKPATFGPMDPLTSPFEPGMEEGEDEGPQLMITGPESQRALALRNDGAVAKAGGQDKWKRGGKGGDQQGHQGPKRKKIRPPKRSGGPKLNTVQAMAAANVASSIGDSIQAANEKNEEATLASQEHVQIRGNDQRHFLIQKLMRTNRSSVICLKNMVAMTDVDEFLEDEIREECSKFGPIVDVVIVQDQQDTENVKIFVRFNEPIQADEAKKSLDGRWFGGRKVLAQNYDQILFEHDDFTG